MPFNSSQHQIRNFELSDYQYCMLKVVKAFFSVFVSVPPTSAAHAVIQSESVKGKS